MNDEQDLMQKMTLGREAEGFIKSNLGRALVSRAQAEIDQAVEGLKRVLPGDKDTITELQNRVYRGESFIVWLEEIFEEGLSAEKELSPEFVDE